MKKLSSLLKGAAIAALLILSLAYAGSSDYDDALRCEAQNSGAYARIAADHPEYTDAEILEIYKSEK